MTMYNRDQIQDRAVPELTYLIQPTMTVIMQHCAISYDTTARLLCFKLTAIVCHCRTNCHSVLRAVHAAYFLQKMAHIVLGEIYLQCEFGFCEIVVFKNVKVLELGAVWKHPCIPINRL